MRARLTITYGTTFTATAAVLGMIYLLMLRWADYRVVTPGPDDVPIVDTSPQVLFGLPVPRIAAESELLGTLWRISAVTLAVGGVAALVIGWVVAGRMLRPISTITGTAARIATGNLHDRVALAGPPDELKDLADTFDTMLERLEAAFEAHRRFAANASHELLTPLATSQAMLEVAVARPAECDVAELAAGLLLMSRRSGEIVGSLLTLARADQGSVRMTPVDLRAVAEAAAGLVRTEAEDHGVTLRTALEPVSLHGDAALLRHLVVNLLRNAIRHNTTGGTADLTVSADGVITVSNTGPAVAPERVEELFEPFVRAAPRTRTGPAAGHGLGLSIVRSVATAHHGNVHAVPNAGGGLTVSVSLPPAPG